MNATYLLIGAAILLCCFSPLHGQSEPEWELFKSKDDIEVYFRESPGTNIREVLIRTRFQAPLAAVVSLINDVERFDEWLEHCQEVKKLKAFSPTRYIYFNRVNFPWPIADREFVMSATMTQDPRTHKVVFHSEATPDFLPPNDKYIRVPETISHWEITPAEDGVLNLEYYLKSDPGGAIPAWVVNLALQTGPFKTMQRLREIAQSEAYRDVQLSYLAVPNNTLLIGSGE